MKLTAEQINALKHNLNWNRHFSPQASVRIKGEELETHRAALISALEGIISDQRDEQQVVEVQRYLETIQPPIPASHVLDRVRVLADRLTDTQDRYEEAVRQNAHMRARFIEQKQQSDRISQYLNIVVPLSNPPELAERVRLLVECFVKLKQEVIDLRRGSVTNNELEINFAASEHVRKKLQERITELEKQIGADQVSLGASEHERRRYQTEIIELQKQRDAVLEPPMTTVTLQDSHKFRVASAQYSTLKNGGFVLTHVYDGVDGLRIHWKNITGCHIAFRYDEEVSQQQLIERVIERTRRAP